MLSTVVTIAAAIGGLIIAGLSAYATYKKTTNKGSHTLTTTSYPSAPIERDDVYERANNYDRYYGYADSYHASAAVAVPQPVINTSGISNSLNTIVGAISNLANQINELKNGMIALAGRIQRIEANRASMYNQPVPTPVPTPIPTPVQVPVPVPTPVIPTPVVPVVPTQMNIIDVTATEPVDVWEKSEDIAVAKVNNGINPAEHMLPAVIRPSVSPDFSMPVQTPNHVVNKPISINQPVSNMGINAMNYNYGFDMNKGFDQYYDSDMHRILSDYRNRYYQSYIPQYCDMPDPYGGLPMSITGGVRCDINPYQQQPSFQQPTMPAPVNNNPETPKPLVFHYGHIGEAFPSTRQSYPYG